MRFSPARLATATFARVKALAGRIELIPDAGKVLRRAWSVRFDALALVLGAVEIGLPYFEAYIPVSKGVFGVMAIAASVVATIARFVAQKNLRQKDDAS